MPTIVLFFLFAALAFSQTTRTVVLMWEDTLNPAGTTYAVYRADGPCSATPPFVKIADATPKTFTDTGVTTGNRYCYVVTALLGEMESEYSNTAQANVKPHPPNKLNVVVK